MSVVTKNVRPAAPGELCTCGRQARDVYEGGRYGSTGHCGLDDGGAPADGVCTFCGDAVDHEHYARAERLAGRNGLPYGGDGVAQGGRCPLYRLRLADPPPAVHPESVRRFDPAADRAERAPGRLRSEIVEILLTAGMDRDEIEDATWEITDQVSVALSQDHDQAGSDAGQRAVGVLLVLLADALDDLVVAPNPADGLDADAVLTQVGGAQTWVETAPCDRPLLVARRLVRRALDPEVPADIYRPWST